MRLQYLLRFSDYYAFNVVHQFLLVTNQLFFIFVASLIAVAEAFDHDATHVVFAWLIAYTGMWLLQLLYNVVVLRSKKNRALLTEHVIEILERTFSDSTQFCVSTYQWPGVISVVSRPGFVAVYTAAHAACIIPNRAFADLQQRIAFLAYIRARTAV